MKTLSQLPAGPLGEIRNQLYRRACGLFGVALTAVSVAGCAGRREVPQVAPQTSPSQKSPNDPHDWRRHRPEPAPKPTVSFPLPSANKLENGFAVYSWQRPATTVSLMLVVRHGPPSSPEKAGLSALTARMLTEGTTKRPGIKLAEAVEALGGDFSVETGRDATTIGIEVLPGDLEAGIGLLAELVQKPEFAHSAFERVRAQSVDNVREALQEPRSLATTIGFEGLLGRALGAPPTGYPSTLSGLKLNDVRDFHAAFYRPEQAALAVAGPVASTDFVGLTARHFGAWRGKRPSKPAAEPSLPKQGKARILLADRPGAPQSAIFGVQAMPNRKAPGYAERELYVTAFGGLFTSRLNQNLREQKAYTYGAFSRYVAARTFGAFAISTSVETRFTADALKEILLELSALHRGKAPLTAEEVDRARADIVHSLIDHFGHTERMAADLVQLFVHDLPLNAFSELSEHAKSAPLAQVQQQGGAWLEPEQVTFTVVGDLQKVRAEIEKLGYPVEVVPTEALR